MQTMSSSAVLDKSGTVEGYYEFFEVLRKEDPDLINFAVPRRYVNPAGYFQVGPLFGVTAFQNTLAMGTDSGEANTSLRCAYMVFLKLAQYKVPTYFVDESFCQAVAATTIAPDLNLGEVRWPMPAMLFEIPMAFAQQHFGRRVGFISMARLEAKEIFAAPPSKVIPNPNASTYFADETAFAVAFEAEEPSNKTLACFHVSAKMSETVAQAIEPEFEYHDTLYDPNRTVIDPLVDKQVAKLVFNFTVKMIMIMSARPQLLEAGACLRSAKAKHGRNRDALWSPNFIGRGYKAKREAQGGTHASPRMHFRRGHLHKYWHGEGKTLSKVRWVEPILVGAGDESARL